MSPKELVDALTDAVERRDGKRFAALFTPDGIYDDVFYGQFAGTDALSKMCSEHFYEHCTDIRWDMRHPLSDGKILYTPYLFSYRSTLPEAPKHRIGFDGVSMMTLSDSKISHYREIANSGPALLDLGFPAERVAKILTRQGAILKAQPEYARHLK